MLVNPNGQLLVKQGAVALIIDFTETSPTQGSVLYGCGSIRSMALVFGNLPVGQWCFLVLCTSPSDIVCFFYFFECVHCFARDGRSIIVEILLLYLPSLNKECLFRHIK